MRPLHPVRLLRPQIMVPQRVHAAVAGAGAQQPAAAGGPECFVGCCRDQVLLWL